MTVDGNPKEREWTRKPQAWRAVEEREGRNGTDEGTWRREEEAVGGSCSGGEPWTADGRSTTGETKPCQQAGTALQPLNSAEKEFYLTVLYNT